MSFKWLARLHNLTDGCIVYKQLPKGEWKEELRYTPVAEISGTRGMCVDHREVWTEGLIHGIPEVLTDRESLVLTRCEVPGPVWLRCP